MDKCPKCGSHNFKEVFENGKDVFEYDIFNYPQHLKGQLKIGDFSG